MALDRILKPRVGYNPAVAMRDLVGHLRGDPAALHGLRRAAVEWLADRGLPGAERKIKGPHPLETLVQNNRAALGQLFTGPELDRLQELGRDVGRMRAESAKSSLVRTTLWRLMAKSTAGFVGFHMGDLPGAVAGVLLEHGVEHLLGGRGAFAHGAAQERLLAEAMHDPNVFAALMQPIDTAKPATVNAAGMRLARALRRAAVVGATPPQQQGQRNGYAKGGTVFDPLQGLNTMFSQIGKLSNPGQLHQMGGGKMNTGAGMPRMPRVA